MIRVRDAEVQYGDVRVFRGTSFDLERGQTGVILGPNGRGKTTLLKAIVGLLTLTAGVATTEGRIGYVAQRNDMAFSYRVLDIVVMGRASHVGLFRTPGAEDYRIARHSLDRLGIGGFADRPYTHLSGGERQLVMIARALASDCDILILDEPTSALDFSNQALILEMLERIAAENGLTVLMTSHVPQHAQLLADKVLLMHGPDRQEWGAAVDMLTEDRLEALYGVPIKALELQHRGRTANALVPLFL
ncbi:ABC transporter ATP-binding protein [Ovoidimarina sediminis]|uniref:ABC transporter ATP-binding protein n=1 Tax=Ovoidimarina sediminis TaxID=3079856 RepID=UPI002915102D|nr:ABC transporter ATP-binding protein [Rhodophyticola sp. MJ-SS7]MDU8944327.1 ABC transporter ATP-binding protein [Rhodophyticola sp. MJ-SS7]